MFANLHPYPAYEPVAELDLSRGLPVGWSVAKLKRVITVRGGSTPAKERVDFWDGQVPWVTPKDMKVSVIADSIDHVSETALRETTLSIVKPGAVLIVVRGMILARNVPTAYVAAPVTINQDMKALVPRASIEGAYLQALLVGQELNVAALVDASGHGTRKIDTDALGNLRIPVPSHDDQRSIVKYLAHANARIDRAIVAKRRMIALLEEEKQAFIDHLVAHAGEGSTPRVRLKNVTTVQTGLTLGKDNGTTPVAEFPYLRVANVQAGDLDLETVTTVRLPPADASRYRLQPMDVLMTEGGDIDKLGRACIWRGEIDNCLHQNHVFAVRCGEPLDPMYLVYLLGSAVGRDYFYRTAKRTTNLASTNSRTLGAFRLALPGLAEQRCILELINGESTRLASLVATVRREIELLHEFKIGLTADVVTGQLDVREVAATLPEVDPVEVAWSVCVDVDHELDPGQPGSLKALRDERAQ